MEKLIDPFSAHERALITRLIFFGILIFEIYLFDSKAFLSQLEQPIYTFSDFDITYWLFNISGLPAFIVRNELIALLFDLCLVSFTILVLLFPMKNRIIAVFYILFFIYFISLNTYTLFHEHLFYGVVFSVLPFLFSSNLTARLLWEFVRYINVFIYGSAFLWKLFRKNYFEFDYFTSIIKSSHTNFFVDPIYSVYSKTLLFLLTTLISLIHLL